MTYREVKRVTASFGFNHTAPGGQHPPLTMLYIGVRENSNAESPVTFSLTATALPRILTDGAVIESVLPPCDTFTEESCRQYFTVPVGSFDILEVHFNNDPNSTATLGARPELQPNPSALPRKCAWTCTCTCSDLHDRGTGVQAAADKWRRRVGTGRGWLGRVGA